MPAQGGGRKEDPTDFLVIRKFLSWMCFNVEESEGMVGDLLAEAELQAHVTRGEGAALCAPVFNEQIRQRFL